MAKQKIRKRLHPVQITLLCLLKGVPRRRNKLLFVFGFCFFLNELSNSVLSIALCALCPVINPSLSVQLTRRSLQKISGGRKVCKGRVPTPFYTKELLGTHVTPVLLEGREPTPSFSGLKVTNPFCTEARRRLGPQGFSPKLLTFWHRSQETLKLGRVLDLSPRTY